MEIGKVYRTKMSDGSMVRLASVVKSTAKDTLGQIINTMCVYIGNEQLGLCPLHPERIIPIPVDKDTWQKHFAKEQLRRAIMFKDYQKWQLERRHNEQAQALRSDSR